MKLLVVFVITVSFEIFLILDNFRILPNIALSSNKNKDFIIFPEIFAHFATKLCIKNKIPHYKTNNNGNIFMTNRK